MKYEIKYEKLPNGIRIIKAEYDDKKIIYINSEKKTSCTNMRSKLKTKIYHDSNTK